MTLPDWLTISRVIATFILLILLQACAHPPVPVWTAWLALTLFVAAALTDWLDGHRGALRAAPASLGARGFRVLEPAPGSYVKTRAPQ